METDCLDSGELRVVNFMVRNSRSLLAMKFRGMEFVTVFSIYRPVRLLWVSLSPLSGKPLVISLFIILTIRSITASLSMGKAIVKILEVCILQDESRSDGERSFIGDQCVGCAGDGGLVDG